MTYMKDTILNLVNNLVPYDDLETRHKDDVMAWIKSNAPLFRIEKPDNPPKHLVSYFVLFDKSTQHLMLIDHIKAQLWLPTGGHVEVDEDPETTVIREAYEELNIKAQFDTVFGNKPFFITVTETKGVGTHTDVSLWYIISGERDKTLAFDEVEMSGYKWLTFQEVLNTDISELDPHMHRFVRKMKHRLSIAEGMELKADFTIPQTLKDVIDDIYKRKTLTQREYIEVCKLGMKLVESHWEYRQGIAYHLAGLWLSFDEVITSSDLLDEIGSTFGNLELPDHFVGKDEKGVKDAWVTAGELVKEADETIEAF